MNLVPSTKISDTLSMLMKAPKLIPTLCFILCVALSACSGGSSSSATDTGTQGDAGPADIKATSTDAQIDVHTANEDAAANTDTMQDTLEEDSSAEAPDAESHGDIIALDIAPDAAPPSYKGQESGFHAGGIVGRYHDGTLESPSDEPGAVFFQRLEPELSLTKTDDAFGAFNEGELFSAHFEGAFFAEEAGTYQFLATASDSVQLKLHGDVVLEVWKAKQPYTAQTLVELEVGWHPLEIVYARDTYRAHLQLWMALDDDEVELVGGELLGYPDTPPEIPASPTVIATLIESSTYSATFALESDIPVQFSSAVDGVSSGASDDSPFHTQEEQTVQLSPGGSYSVTFTGTDPWDREFTSEAIVIDTPTVPAYTPGGLLGTYYGDTSFETSVGIRLDPRLHLPQDTDGDKAGCFQTAMPDNNFSVRWEGGLKVETPGEYILYLGSDDGQRLYVDGVLIAHNWVGHALSYVQKKIYLAAGWHPLVIELYEGGGSAEIHFEWEQVGGVRALVPPENLGAIIPEQPTEAPSILSFTSEPSGTNVKAIWTSSKLSTAAVTILSGDATDPAGQDEDNGWDEAKAILDQKCADCHTTGSSGGWNTADHSTIQLDSGNCADVKIYDCILERIQDGSMPPQNVCTGDPAIDGNASDCLDADQQAVIAAWVEGGGGGPPVEPEVINFDTLATGFSYRFTEIPTEGFTVSLQLEDTEGQLSAAQELVITPPAE